MNSTLSQPYAFLIFLYGGIVAGLVFDLCTLLRLLLAKWRSAAAADVLYAFCLLPILACTFFYATSGVPRLYGFLSMLLGAHIERMSVSRLVADIAAGLSRKTKL